VVFSSNFLWNSNGFIEFYRLNNEIVKQINEILSSWRNTEIDYLNLGYLFRLRRSQEKERLREEWDT